MSRFYSNKRTEEEIREAINALEINELENYVSERVQPKKIEPIIEAKVEPKIEQKIAPAKKEIKIENNLFKNLEFISVVKDEPEIMSEEDFFKIVGVKNRKLTSTARRYQRSLYGHYMCAKKENDEGYINDVLMKAKMFKENLDEVEKLMMNKSFMNAWVENVGHVSPLEDLKENGRMIKVNIVKSYMK